MTTELQDPPSRIAVTPSSSPSTTSSPTPSAPTSGPAAGRAKRKLHMKVPEWAYPLLKPCRLKGLSGGRGGGKSHQAIELQIMRHIQFPNRSGVYIREVQRSIKDSVYQLIKDKIKTMGLQKHFDVKSTEIRSTKGSGKMLFIGMKDHTAVTIKSLEGMDYAVVEEAQTISQTSIDMLLPTIRKEGAEVWFIWNPKNKSDPVDKLFAGVLPHEAIHVRVNYRQNRHASSTLIAEAERCKRVDPDKYKHVYGGGYEEYSEARIFKHLIVDEDFELPRDLIAVGGLRLGCDWGFSVDPLVLLAGYVEGRDLYVRYEAYETGVEIEDTRAHFLTVPGSTKWTITAGRERPERIRSAQRQGFKIKAAVGGNHSEIEGIEHLQNYTIHIHRDCIHAKEEFENYKHPVDRLTGKIMPVLPASKNHLIEAARYMVEDIRRFEQGKKPPPPVKLVPTRHHWRKTARG